MTPFWRRAGDDPSRAVQRVPGGAILLETGHTNRLKWLRISARAQAAARLSAIIDQRMDAS